MGSLSMICWSPTVDIGSLNRCDRLGLVRVRTDGMEPVWTGTFGVHRDPVRKGSEDGGPPGSTKGPTGTQPPTPYRERESLIFII